MAQNPMEMTGVQRLVSRGAFPATLTSALPDAASHVASHCVRRHLRRLSKRGRSDTLSWARQRRLPGPQWEADLGKKQLPCVVATIKERLLLPQELPRSRRPTSTRRRRSSSTAVRADGGDVEPPEHRGRRQGGRASWTSGASSAEIAHARIPNGLPSASRARSPRSDRPDGCLLPRRAGGGGRELGRGQRPPIRRNKTRAAGRRRVAWPKERRSSSRVDGCGRCSVDALRLLPPPASPKKPSSLLLAHAKQLSPLIPVFWGWVAEAVAPPALPPRVLLHCVFTEAAPPSAPARARPAPPRLRCRPPPPCGRPVRLRLGGFRRARSIDRPASGDHPPRSHQAHALSNAATTVHRRRGALRACASALASRALPSTIVRSCLPPA